LESEKEGRRQKQNGHTQQADVQKKKELKRGSLERKLMTKKRCTANTKGYQPGWAPSKGNGENIGDN